MYTLNMYIYTCFKNIILHINLLFMNINIVTIIMTTGSVTSAQSWVQNFSTLVKNRGLCV